MPLTRLQPKQGAILDLIEDSPAPWIGMGGGRGCAKSFGIDAIMLTRRMAHPGTVGCVVMRNYDQVRKYHMEPIRRTWPELDQYFNKSESNLKIPMGGDSFSQIDFSYAESLSEVERRFRSANYFDIFVDQAEQFTEPELREMKLACRWPETAKGRCKMLLSFNMGGAGIQTLRKWFHTREYNERETAQDFEFIHFYPWDNVEWSRVALAEEGLTEDDYYSWSHEERMLYCATKTEYGKTLNSLDDALRNRDWLSSWESLEGAYFGRVFDRNAMMVNHQQFKALVRPWDYRWLSQDWGKSHFCVTHWHAKIILTPEKAREVLDWDIAAPINAVVTYRELVLSEMSAPDVAKAIVDATPVEERKHIRQFHLSPDAYGDRDSPLTIADRQGTVMRQAGMPWPVPACNERISGWGLMYNLMQSTSRRGSDRGDVWLATVECPQVFESIPLAMRDVKNLDDVTKTDKGQARLEQDVLDGLRYGIRSEIRPRTEDPVEVRRAAEFEKHAGNPTAQHIAMLQFKAAEMRRNTIGRGQRVR